MVFASVRTSAENALQFFIPPPIGPFKPTTGNAFYDTPHPIEREKD
jgi:hypothetical protein